MFFFFLFIIPDKVTRDRAVTALRKFLSGQVGSEEDRFQDELFEARLPEDTWETIEPKKVRLDEMELAKLYKGLFYCYWMSDKPIVQQHLAQELADLCLIIRPAPSSDDDPLLDQVFTTQTALSFWKQFWIALGSEWQGVDKHRLDKYLLLMRRFVEVAFKILQRAHWHPKAIELWSEILKETVFKYVQGAFIIS
jgi:ribosomal RNA-processing protein 1